MSSNRLGPKKHARCEALAGRAYTLCMVRGAGRAIWCSWAEPSGRQSSDALDLQAGTVTPIRRDGVWVGEPVQEAPV